MKPSRRIVIALALATAALSVVALAGCTVSGGYSFDGGKVSVSGKDLTITVDGNPTTGYEWTANVSGDGIEQGDVTYTQTTNVGLNAGAGGSYEFKFTGKSAGSSVITLTYARSWETTNEDETIVFNVTTNASGNITHVDTVIGNSTVGTFSS